MKLYTAKIVGEWLSISERRVRQLRDEGIISEVQPGLYDLKRCVNSYIEYIRGKGRTDLNDERAMLTKAKREAAEMENRVRRGELLESKDIELALKTMLLSFRGRLLTLPSKLAPLLSAMGGKQDRIYDELQKALEETMEDLSDCNKLGLVADEETDDRYDGTVPFDDEAAAETDLE